MRTSICLPKRELKDTFFQKRDQFVVWYHYSLHMSCVRAEVVFREHPKTKSSSKLEDLRVKIDCNFRSHTYFD